MTRRSVTSRGRAAMQVAAAVSCIVAVCGCEQQSTPPPVNPPDPAALTTAEVDALRRLGELYASNAAILNRAIDQSGVMSEGERAGLWSNMLEMREIEGGLFSIMVESPARARSLCEGLESMVLPSHDDYFDVVRRDTGQGRRVGQLLRAAAPSDEALQEYIDESRTADDTLDYLAACIEFGYID